MAAATLQEVLPVEHGKLPDNHNDASAQSLIDICAALGMDPNPANGLQKPDMNFLQA